MATNRKKTILFLITQSEMGGAQKYVFDLANNLKDNFNIAVAFGEQGEKGELAQKLKNANIKYYVIPHLKRTISFKTDFKALREIKKLYKQVKPDIIHLNSTKISVLGSLAAWFYKSKIFKREPKVIYTVHGWVFNEPERQGDFYKKTEKFTARFKDKIICVSQADHDLALKEKISPSEKLITIHNGIESFEILSRSEARAKLNLDNDALVVGSIGNLYKTKDYENLISAIKILVDNKIDIKTIIIGEGQERPELENWISQYRLEKNVFLVGRLIGARLLSAFDFYTCSSIKEGLSYTLIEAMTAGLPIVATNVGGNSELIKNNETGLLVPASNPEELARALIKLINEPDLKTKLGQQAKIQAEKEFTLEKMLNRTQEVYLS